MKNYKFGYARVSTEEQVLDRQIDMLSEYGVNQIYSEKMTGTKRNRPELEKDRQIIRGRYGCYRITFKVRSFNERLN